MSGETVVKFPNEMEVFAREAQIGVEMVNRSDADIAKARDQRMDGALKASIALYNARRRFKDDYLFGRWCHENNLGENVLSKDDRAAFVEFGSDPNRARQIFAKTKRNSWREIRRLEWDTPVSQPAKPPSVGGDKTHAVHAALQANEAVGIKLTQKQIAEALDVSTSTVGEATRDLKAAKTAEIFTYTKAQEAHVEARIKALDKAREATFDERVRLAMLERNKDYRAVLEESKKRADEGSERYEKLINNFKPVFTEVEFVTILTCLHPDNSASKEKRDTAFKAFNAMKFQLTGKK